MNELELYYYTSQRILKYFFTLSFRRGIRFKEACPVKRRFTKSETVNIFGQASVSMSGDHAISLRYLQTFVPARKPLDKAQERSLIT